MITYSRQRDISIEQVIPIYKLNGWSSAQKPDALHKALLNSHSLISAWNNEQLVGIANAISDGFLVVYYPHLLVHPDYQQQGIGKELMRLLREKYSKMHMHMLVADSEVVRFYQKCGFTRAGETEPMWIYEGKDH